MLINDLIDALPKKSVAKVRVRKDFDEGMAQAKADEEGVRETFVGLIEGTTRGGESLALAVYMDIARRRLKNFGVEEDKFKVWAGECLVEMGMVE